MIGDLFSPSDRHSSHLPLLPAHVPDAGHLRGDEGEDPADRPAALHRLRLLCRGLPDKVPHDGHAVPVALTARGGVIKVTVAGPKRKEPVAPVDGVKPEKKE
jgi:hypothetical protein